MTHDSLKERFCPKPFEFLSIDAEGRGWLCCGDWLPTSVGPVDALDPGAIWNSETAQRIRASILDGSFAYCRADRCPSIVQGRLPWREQLQNRHRELVESGATTLKCGPSTLSLGYDNSCNLKCPTCRPGIIQLKGEEYARAELLQNALLSHDFLGAHTLIITGHGDAFGSRLFRGLLASFDSTSHPGIQIVIMTNGLLLNEALWQSMERAHGAISGITVSVDAATADTYKKNRGASFLRLRSNLEFIGQLYREGAIRWFEISFVVQANNFREMPLFVEFGFELGCTSILFQKLIHWEEAMSLGAYRDAAVHEVWHAEHGDFMKVLQHPAFRDAKVDLSNLEDLVPWSDATK